jgi:hypothetical protein
MKRPATPPAIPGQVRDGGGVAGKGHSDGRAQADALGVQRSHPQRQEGIVLRLAGPQRVEADGFGRLRQPTASRSVLLMMATSSFMGISLVTR